MNGEEKEKRIKKVYIILAAAITAVFAACAVFVFPSSFWRLIESVRDFGLSVAFYFCELLEIPHEISPTVNDYSVHISTPAIFLPETWQGFKDNWTWYWQIWATKENFAGYFSWLGNAIGILSKILLLALPLFLLLLIMFKRAFEKRNNAYAEDSKPLKLWKRIARLIFIPTKKFIVGFVGFVRERKKLYTTWILIWIYNFNLCTVLLEFLSFYFYFVVSFDAVNIYRQVYKLFVDLYPMMKFVPICLWLVIGYIFFDVFRKKIAYARLNHFERRNRGFINARPIVYMVCGTMGKKKTTAITDMALSQEIMFRDKAFEKILENDLKFPYFPWINLENEMKQAMAHRTVFNLATTRQFIEKKHRRFLKSPCSEKIFGYDYKRYGVTYDDRLKSTDIWEILSTYAQLYFIYVAESSLIISNYSVRVDSVMSDSGNFPLWNSDLFRKDSRFAETYSRHAHILDFDSLRLGKKLVKNNIKANSFEFGVVLITEIGKERGNNLFLQEMKKNSDTTNQKNDFFNSWLKLVRHSATVDNFPFVRVITDEQRPESWGADARDLCEIVHIKDSGDEQLAMPFFSLGDLVYSWLYRKFSELYYKYRFNRSDNTLLMYFLKSVTARISHYYNGIYNRFGYCILSVQIESGTQDGQLESNKYFLMSKKIYSKRFSTDCFSDFFVQKALRSPIGINDLPEYSVEKATLDELSEQNSYFINDLVKGFHNDEKEAKNND